MNHFPSRFPLSLSRYPGLTLLFAKVLKFPNKSFQVLVTYHKQISGLLAVIDHRVRYIGSGNCKLLSRIISQVSISY